METFSTATENIGGKMIPIKYVITEEEFLDLIGHLTQQLILKGYSGIYPIPMGGFPVAAKLSERLGLSIIPKTQIDSRTLIVDDLIDSGKTISQFPDHDKAVLLVKHKIPNPKNTTVGRELRNPNQWIIFPWEDEKTPDITHHITSRLFLA